MPNEKTLSQANLKNQDCRQGRCLPAPVREALERVLNYLWDEEFENFLNADTHQLRNHILLSLTVLREYLDQTGVCERREPSTSKPTEPQEPIPPQVEPNIYRGR